MAMTYRRHSGSNGTTWSPITSLPSPLSHQNIQSPPSNHPIIQSPFSTTKIRKPSSSFMGIGRSISQRSMLYQTATDTGFPPSPIQLVAEDHLNQPSSVSNSKGQLSTTSHGSPLTPNLNVSSGATLKIVQSPVLSSNRTIYSPVVTPKIKKPSSPSIGVSRSVSERSTPYQSTSQAVSPPSSIQPVLEDQIDQAFTDSSSNSKEDGSKNEKNPQTRSQRKGKEPAIVRTRPIFHANLAEAKKYHQNQLKTSSPRKVPISPEEVISRYCDHFKFQLPTLEVDRFKETGKKRVFLSIKRRLLGIGEGRTTFEAMLAAYDDTVFHLFKGDSALKNQLLRSNEAIEWNHIKVGKT